MAWIFWTNNSAKTSETKPILSNFRHLIENCSDALITRVDVGKKYSGFPRKTSISSWLLQCLVSSFFPLILCLVYKHYTNFLVQSTLHFLFNFHWSNRSHNKVGEWSRCRGSCKSVHSNWKAVYDKFFFFFHFVFIFLLTLMMANSRKCLV